VLLGIKLKTLVFHIVLAIFIALVLSPAIERLARTRLSRGASIAVVVIAVAIAAAGIGATVATPLASSGIKFARNAPEYLREAAVGKGPLARTAARFHLQKQLAKSVPSISKALSHISTDVLSFGRRVASAAFAAAIVLILAIFMLVEGPRMVGNAIVAIPEQRRDAARRIGRSVARVVSGYTTGVLLMAALNGLVTVAALTATGTPFVVPLAVWAAVVDILPIVGGLLGIVPAGLFAFGKSLPAGIIVIVVMFLYQQVKNHLLYPVLVGRAVQMNSLLVLVTVLVGADLGHVAGAVLAIPVAGTLQTFLIEIARERAGLPPSDGPEEPPVDGGRLKGRFAKLVPRRRSKPA
jgi:predicted PurR-regulated permease PerM